MKRSNPPLWIDRGLAGYTFLVVFYSLLSYVNEFGLLSWDRALVMGLLYAFMLVMAGFLWIGTELGYRLTRLFYLLQIPTTLGLGSLAYDFNGGLKLAVGWMNADFRISALFLYTNLYLGRLDIETERSVGIVINFFAIVATIYYSLRLRRLYESQTRTST